MLGLDPGSAGRAATGVNCWAVYPGLSALFLRQYVLHFQCWHLVSIGSNYCSILFCAFSCHFPFKPSPVLKCSPHTRTHTLLSPALPVPGRPWFLISYFISHVHTHSRAETLAYNTPLVSYFSSVGPKYFRSKKLSKLVCFLFFLSWKKGQIPDFWAQLILHCLGLHQAS